MQWSPQQEAAIDDVGRWLQNRTSQYYYLAGYAGTGKTTLARHLASGVNGEVRYAAFTGKAAHMMQKAGCEGATTIHRLIYRSLEKSKKKVRELEAALRHPTLSEREKHQLEQELAAAKKYLKQPKFELDPDSDFREASLLVLDECSMVNKKMAMDILSFDVPVLVLGDPAQLPPVGGEGWFTAQKPRTLLTEIHRQAKDSPIIRLATMARNGQAIPCGQYGSSVVTEERVKPDVALEHQQMLVRYNKTRKALNARVRGLKGFQGSLPDVGDRLVCLRNNHELGLLNGSVWLVGHASSDGAGFVDLHIQSPDDELYVQAHEAPFVGEEVDYWSRRDAEEFDYGYAFTVHKAQGSQWESVLVFDESAGMKRSEKNQWLYTAITRASERVTISR